MQTKTQRICFRLFFDLCLSLILGQIAWALTQHFYNHKALKPEDAFAGLLVGIGAMLLSTVFHILDHIAGYTFKKLVNNLTKNN